MKSTVSGFFGKYRFLSNFTPVQIILDGVLYPSVEHAYQAAKTLDETARLTVLWKYDSTGKEMGYNSPGEAKRAGKGVPLRSDWDEVKLQVMEGFLKQKFSNGLFREALIATGVTELIEVNTWNDTYWGVCKGKGHNHLGKLLMKIRSEQLEWKQQYGTKNEHN